MDETRPPILHPIKNVRDDDEEDDWNNETLSTTQTRESGS
jgi:hypothetical protein